MEVSGHFRAFRQARRLAYTYERYGYCEQADKVRSCGKAYSFYVCHECGEYCYLADFHCDDRLCALCARARVARLLVVYKEAFKGLKSARMVTVSMRSRGVGELKSAVKDLWAALSRLRHRSIWKSVRGAVVSLEITFNRDARTWHPHLHILADGDYINWHALLSDWRAVTLGEGSSVYIQQCRKGWERELVKYITKAGQIMRDEEAFREFLAFAKGRRFIRTYGSLYNCAAQQEQVAGPIHCRGCGAVMELEKPRVKIEEIYPPETGRVVENALHENSPPRFDCSRRDDLLASDASFVESSARHSFAG